MGVLDDAIRDHLELKRRHGAPEAEIAEAEAEALGPARREPAGAAAEPGDPDEPVADAGGETELLEPAGVPELHEVEPQAPATELHEVDPPAAVEPVPELREVEPEAPEAVPELHEAAAELNEATPELHEPVPELADEPPPATPSEPDAVEPPEPSSRPHGDPALEDDMLEPDEVPDNERLWFEQKPKRDFDFDE